MPPKAAKQKSDATPAKPNKPFAKASVKKPTNVKEDSSSASENDDEKPAVKETPSKASPAKKARTAADVKHLSSTGKDPIHVKVTYNDTTHATKAKNGTLIHQIKLEATEIFELVTTQMVTDGEYAGCQAVFIRPARPFKFMQLPAEARRKIYHYYFVNNHSPGGPITIDGKRKNGDLYAKAYGEGSKERVALLAVSKLVKHEAQDVLYNSKFLVDNPNVLAFWLSTEFDASRLRYLEIGHWSKVGIRIAVNLLCTAHKLERLTFREDVTKEPKVDKAALAFWTDFSRVLNMMANHLLNTHAIQERAEVVDHIEFGRRALWKKDAVYDAAMVHEFKEVLKSKLKTQAWACICGSREPNHSCAVVIERPLIEDYSEEDYSEEDLEEIGRFRHAVVVAD